MTARADAGRSSTPTIRVLPDFSDRSLRRLGVALSGLSILSAPVTMVLMWAAGVIGQAVENYSLTNALSGLCFGVLGIVLVRTEPRNRLVWFFVVAGLCISIPGPINGALELVASAQGVDADHVDVDGWPVGVASALGFGYSLWTVGAFGLPTIGLLLAPDGRLLSPRWRPVAFASIAVIATLLAAFASFWPIRTNQPDLDNWATAVIAAGFPALLVLVATSFGSLLLRYRRSDGATRRRLRWVLLGSTSAAAGGLATWAHPLFTVVLIPLLAVCYGIAIWRDQLFDVDVVISRTLVYLSILATIGAIYVAVVFGVGSLLGRRLTDTPVLPLVATVVVALAVQPLRGRLERWANRIVFGRRATPYEVLSDFTKRVAATDDQLVSDVARSLVDGTVATGATVWTLEGGLLRSISSWPPDGQTSATVALRSVGQERDLVMPGVDLTRAIRHDGRIIGAIGLRLPPGENLPPADVALVGELAAGTAVALHNRELTLELRARVDDLRTSRRRLVAVQDATRHGLERDLHDGAQQRLVAAKVRLAIAAQMAAKAGAEATATELGRLCTVADHAIESLRDVARGVYPPLLEAEGLGAALVAQLDRLPLTVDLSCAVTNRQPREIEATVYFAVVETLGAVERASRAGPVTVAVGEDESSIRFEITADVGLAVDRSNGLDWRSDVENRIEAIGGAVVLGPRPTVLQASVPTRSSQDPDRPDGASLGHLEAVSA